MKKKKRTDRRKNETVVHHPALNQNKLVTLVFYGKYVQHFTKLFKNTNVRIAPKNNSTLQKVLPYKTTESESKCNRSGIYVLWCPDYGSGTTTWLDVYFTTDIVNIFVLVNKIPQTRLSHNSSEKNIHRRDSRPYHKASITFTTAMPSEPSVDKQHIFCKYIYIKTPVSYDFTLMLQILQCGSTMEEKL
jgi:hypothetical protein